MLSFQIASDLHLEKLETNTPDPLEFIQPSAPNIVLAGDIGSLYRFEQLTYFFKKLSAQFKRIIYVPGNHEWYKLQNFQSLPMNVLNMRLLSLEDDIDNLHVLNQTSMIIDDICICGATLWSRATCIIPHFIVRTPSIRYSYNRIHDSHLKYICNMISYCLTLGLKLLVITHHVPTYDLIAERANSPYISLYASHLDRLLSSKYVHTWICGHIHKNFDYITEGGTRLVGNQKGKIADKVVGFQKDKVILI